MRKQKRLTSISLSERFQIKHALVSINEAIDEKTLDSYSNVLKSLSNVAGQKDLVALKSILDRERDSFIENIKNPKKAQSSIAELSTFLIGIAQGISQLSKLSDASGLDGDTTKELPGSILSNSVNQSYQQIKGTNEQTGGTPDEAIKMIANIIESNPTEDITKIIDSTKNDAPEYRKRLEGSLSTMKKLRSAFLEAITPKKENLGKFKSLFQAVKNAASGNVMKGLSSETFNQLFNQLIMTDSMDRAFMNDNISQALKNLDTTSSKTTQVPMIQNTAARGTNQIVSKTAEELKINKTTVQNVVDTIKNYIQTASKGGTKITGDAAIAGLAGEILKSLKR